MAGLVAAGAVAGLVSTVASVASVVSYPVLLAIGLPPLAANVTNTVALLFTGVGAAAGSRPELAGQRARLLRLGPACVAGGAAGAAVLLLTPASWFGYAAPVLIAAGSVILLIPRPAARTPDPAAGTPAAGTPAAGEAVPGWALGVAVAAVACYIGYFGAAGGILLLVVLIPMLGQSLARTNAVKNVVNGLANGVAAVGFAAFGPVRWLAVLPLAAGFLAGGWTGPKLVRLIPGRLLRILIGIGGIALAVRLGLSAYH